MSVVIYGPQGSGKTLHAEELRRHFKCSRVVEMDDPLAYNVYRNWGPALRALNVLILTDQSPPPALASDLRILSIKKALQLLAARKS